MKIPVKKEKLAQKFEICVSPSLMSLRREVEKKFNLEFCEWARLILEFEMNRLLNQSES